MDTWSGWFSLSLSARLTFDLTLSNTAQNYIAIALKHARPGNLPLQDAEILQKNIHILSTISE